MKIIKEILDNIIIKLQMFVNKDSFETIYSEAISLYENDKIELALEKFKQASKKHDATSQVYYNLALCYQRQQDWKNAIDNYYKFLQDNPKDYDGTYNLSLIYFNQKNFVKAKESFERCILIKREDTALRFLTESYLNMNNSERALELAKQMFATEFPLDLSLATAKAFSIKADNFKHKDLLEYAIEMYSKIIQRFPTCFDAFMELSNCYSKMGDWNKSIETAMEALKLDSNSFAANNQIGLVYYCSEDMKNSIIYYKKAFKLKPKDEYKIYSNLAYAYEKDGNYSRAINLFEAMIKRFPNCPIQNQIQSHIDVLKNTKRN